MSESSSQSNRRAAMPNRGDECMDGAPSATVRMPVMNGTAVPPVLDSVDPLTRQLRHMYGAIADEPIPDAIAALLERLKG
jgi:hypothetical protein